MQRHTQQDALERARRGDPQAQSQLLEGFRPYLACILRAMNLGRLKARLGESDLMQEILLEAHRAFGQFQGLTVPELTGWMRQVAIRTTGHVLRSQAAGKRALGREQADVVLESLMQSSSSPSEEAMRHEQAARLADGLARLPDDMQQVLLGRHMDDLPYAELAGKFGRSEGAVRVLYFRALERLRKELVS